MEVATASSLLPGAPRLDVAAHFALPNGVQVLHYSRHADTGSDSVTIGICIGAGHLDDPLFSPGLARVVERLLLCGSDRYPEWRGLPLLCEKAGGVFASHTSTEQLQFLMQAPVAVLREVLDRVTDMLTAPTLPADALPGIVAELEAEHVRDSQDAAFQQWQLLCEFAAPDHPLHSFGRGSQQSLQPLVAEGGLREAAQEWVSTFVSAAAVSCCVADDGGVLNTDDLHSVAVETLMRVHRRPEPERPWAALPPVGADQLGTLVTVHSAEPQLRVCFPCPLGYAQYASNMMGMFTALIGGDQDSGLAERLCSAGLAESCWADVELQGREHSILAVSVQLTAAGERDCGAVIAAVFQACYVLRALGGRAMWDKLRAEAACTLALRTPPEPSKAALSLSRKLAQHAPPSHICVASEAYLEWSDRDFAALRESLTPTNCVCFFHRTAADASEVPYELDWGYGVRYGVAAMDAETVSSWSAKAADPRYLADLPEPRWLPTELHCSSERQLREARVVDSWPMGTVVEEVVCGQAEAVVAVELQYDVCAASVRHAAAFALVCAAMEELTARVRARAERHRIRMLLGARSQCRLVIAAHGLWPPLSDFIPDAFRSVVAAAQQAAELPASMLDDARCRAATCALASEGGPDDPCSSASAAVDQLLSPERPHGAAALIEALSELHGDALAQDVGAVLHLPSRTRCFVSAPVSAGSMVGGAARELLRGLRETCACGQLGSAPEPCHAAPPPPPLDVSVFAPPPVGLPPVLRVTALQDGLSPSVALSLEVGTIGSAAATAAGAMCLSATAGAMMVQWLGSDAAQSVVRCRGRSLFLELLSECADGCPFARLRQLHSLARRLCEIPADAIAETSAVLAAAPLEPAQRLLSTRELAGVAHKLGGWGSLQEDALTRWLRAAGAGAGAFTPAELVAALGDAASVASTARRLLATLPVAGGGVASTATGRAVLAAVAAPTENLRELPPNTQVHSDDRVSFHWRGLEPVSLPSSAAGERPLPLLLARCCHAFALSPRF